MVRCEKEKTKVVYWYFWRTIRKYACMIRIQSVSYIFLFFVDTGEHILEPSTIVSHLSLILKSRDFRN